MEIFPECQKIVDIENGSGLDVNKLLIPDALLHLVPIVNKWSFDHLADQDVFIRIMSLHRSDELNSLIVVFDENVRSLIRDWSKQIISNRHILDIENNVWDNPYWHYLNVLKLIDAIPQKVQSQESHSAKIRFCNDVMGKKFAEISELADDAFTDRDYVKFISLLSPFPEMLTKIQLKKVIIAKKAQI